MRKPIDLPESTGTQHEPPSVRVHDLTKTFGEGPGEVNAVRGASFEMWDGEFVAIVGPSGSGKTTLLAMLGGLLTPSAGSIQIHHWDLSAMSRSQLTRFRREAIGFVFQAGNLLPYLTAWENVEIMAEISGDRSVKERARELIRELGLAERADAVATELSGGERQRVAIARALANAPDLVLVDEPTANLDSVLGEQVVRMFAREVHDRHISAIMVTHDDHMAAFADRVLEMRDGILRDASSRAPQL